MITISSFSAVFVGLTIHFVVPCLFIRGVGSGWTVTLRNPLPGSSLAGACTVPRGGHREFLVDLLSFSTFQYKFPRRILREIPKPQAGDDQFRNGLARYADAVVGVSASCKGGYSTLPEMSEYPKLGSITCQGPPVHYDTMV